MAFAHCVAMMGEGCCKKRNARILANPGVLVTNSCGRSHGCDTDGPLTIPPFPQLPMLLRAALSACCGADRPLIKCP